MSSTPRFRYAVVIPTRNRQRYCVEAARSALATRREDVQVIVADASDDPRRLPALLTAARVSDRVRLLPAPGRRLSMRENWERALEAADAEWTLYIGDDDALLPDSFESFDALTDRLPALCFSWETIDYRWPCYPGGSGGQMVLPLEAPAAAFVDAKAFLEQHRTWRTEEKWPAIGPSIYHGLVHRSLIERIRAERGQYFQNFVVDYASAIFNLAAIDGFAYLRAPLSVLGACGSSNSAGLTAAEKAASKLDETLAENPGLRPIYPELCRSRLSVPLVAMGYQDLFDRLGLRFEITPPKLLTSALSELRGIADAAAFEREKENLLDFAMTYGLLSAPVARMSFLPHRCGIGPVDGRKRLFVDTRTLGWRGVCDLLSHIHALTPRHDAQREAAIDALVQRLGRKAA